MSSKREAMDISTMSTEQKAELAMMLVNDHEVAKLAREKGAKINKSATLAPSERKPSKTTLMAEIVAEINALFGAKYDDAQAGVSTVVMEAMDKYNTLCAEKDLAPAKKAKFAPNGEDTPGYKFVTRGSGSTVQFDPVVYTLSGNKASTKVEKAIVKVLTDYGEYAPCAAEIKHKAGLSSKANIQKALGKVAVESGKISRSDQIARLEAL